MRAVRAHGTGDPSVLRVNEVPEPRPPRRDEILISVQAASINGTDLILRRGELPILRGSKPRTLGFDLAGEVLSCGPAVTAFRPGDRVIALLGHTGGAQAERVLVRQGRAALAPRSCSVPEAATLPLAGLTALQALYGRAQLRAFSGTPRVLILGAAGGIGSFAVQLAKLAGAHVTGVASSAKLDYVGSLGADAVLDYRAEPLTHASERWDVVFDCPARYRFGAVRERLTESGVFVSTRPIDPNTVRLLAPTALLRGGRPAAAGKRFDVVATRARSADLAQLAALVDSGLLRAPLDRVFALDEVAKAHRHAESAVTGKVVLRL